MLPFKVNDTPELKYVLNNDKPTNDSSGDGKKLDARFFNIGVSKMQ